ncbi:MAG: hypothetical protein GX288_05660 [Clostridiales bacterium]|nr:hypothetical protein [Clostridiales bacterium]
MTNKYVCPICGSKDLTLRHEASYIYSYIIDSDVPGLKNSKEFHSYQYDKREQKDSRDYVECNLCRTQYPQQFLSGVLLTDNRHGENQML